MMKMLYIALFALKKVLRDRGMLIGMIAMPVLFMFILGSAFGGASEGSSKIPVSIANEDGERYAKELVDYMKANRSLDVKIMSSDEVYDSVRNADVEVGYIIPKGFSQSIKTGSKAKIQVVKLGENQSATTISTIMNGYISKIKTAYITADTVKTQLKDDGIFDKVYTQTLAKLNKPAVTVKVEEITKSAVERDNKKSYSLNIGFVVVFVMFMVTFAMGTILQEKKEGTWGRLLSTPTSSIEILGGHFLGVLAQGYMQMFILVVLTSILFKTYWGNSYLLLFIVISAFLVAVMGLGLMLSGFVRTYAQLGALGPIVIVPTSMISGTYWPVDIMPDFMQKLALFMPQYWAMKGIVSLVLGGGNFTNILMPVLILLGFAVVFFAIGIGLLRG